LAVGDPTGQLNQGDRVGRAFVFSGRTHQLLRTLSPPWPTDFYGVNYGSNVRAIGDVNADGADDIAVGASGDSDPGYPTYAGRVRVYSGATGALLYSLMPLRPRGVLEFGHDLDRVPDVNADGVDDLIVGSSWEESAYIFSGATGQLVTILTAPPDVCSCQFGTWVAGIPDLDNDGHGDAAVGSREPIEPGSDIIGVVYILSGATGHVLFRIPGLCRSLAGIGDLDGDGMGELLIAGYWDSTIRVISGATGEVIRILHSPRIPPSDALGTSLAAVPDMDNDGYPDILAGSIREPIGYPMVAGAAYLFSGHTGALLRSFVSPQPQESGRFGCAVSAVPDCNGDGKAELLIGAFQETFDNFTSRGRAYMFLSCPADLNADGVATSQDFFDFLNLFFTSSPGADFNRDSTIDSRDFFDFLAAFFAGCP
jgi:hypothetical protein